MTIIAQSLLDADLGNLSVEIQKVSQAGADWLHIDVMDGSFVPPITFGTNIVKVAKRSFTGIVDVHLMTEHPETHVQSFAEAGADIITIHAEVSPHLHRTVDAIHQLGKKAGVAINPATPLTTVEQILPQLDLLLLMTVNPGWGGQKYIPTSTAKITAAAEMIKRANSQAFLEVDGGINSETSPIVRRAGATVLVVGTAVFRSQNYAEAITAIRG